jgi:hypothetical protein
MKLGLYLRNMGPQSTRAPLIACARAAEAAGVDDLPAAAARVRAFAKVGATRLVHAARYADAGEFARAAESLGSLLPAARDA